MDQNGRFNLGILYVKTLCGPGTGFLLPNLSLNVAHGNHNWGHQQKVEFLVDCKSDFQTSKFSQKKSSAAFLLFFVANLSIYANLTLFFFTKTIEILISQIESLFRFFYIDPGTTVRLGGLMGLSAAGSGTEAFLSHTLTISVPTADSVPSELHRADLTGRSRPDQKGPRAALSSPLSVVHAVSDTAP